METFLNNMFNSVVTDTDINPDLSNPLVLAYIGDSIHSLFIRYYLITIRKDNVHVLHKLSIKYVSAHSQAIVAHSISDMLTEKETQVLKRGRNAHSGTVPKNADLTDYKYATGLEALFGWLFLKKNFERLSQLLQLSTKISEEKIK